MDINLFGGIAKAEYIKPAHNTMPMIDFRNGNFVKGSRGEMILNGGSHKYTGVVGFPNTYKTSLCKFFMNNDYLRYGSFIAEYDTEGHSSYHRAQVILDFMSHGQCGDLSLDDRYLLTSIEQYKTDKFWAIFNDKLKEFIKAKVYVTTPFVGPDGKNIKVRFPISGSIDSITQAEFTATEKIQNTDLGASERNTGDMNNGRFKNQLISELPYLLGVTGMKMYMSGQMGPEFQIATGPNQAPKEKQVSYIKDGYKVKGAPDSYLRLTNDTWCILRATPHTNQGTKDPEYPSKRISYSGTSARDTELSKLQVIPLRGKNGPAGDPFVVISSQHQGVQEALTNLHFLREVHKYSFLAGNNTTFTTHFLPDEKMQRTTVRDKLYDNPKLARALEITAELKLAELNQSIPRHLLCTPEQLYAGIKEKGYDWNDLLDTRRWWTYEHLEKDLPPYLSIYDLLRMKEGTYEPYWKR